MSDRIQSHKKSTKEQSKDELAEMGDTTAKFLGGVLGDIKSRSAYSQMVIGVTSGWITGFATGRVGKIAAFLIGGGIIVMQVAHHEGLIRIDWSRVSRKLDKVSDKVEGAVSGHQPTWMDKADRFIDRKLDRAEDNIKKTLKKGKRWYSNLIGDEQGPKINDLHIFLTAFVGGVALGLASA